MDIGGDLVVSDLSTGLSVHIVVHQAHGWHRGGCRGRTPGWAPAITDAQVRRLREKRMAGKTLAAADAAAGMSERAARKWQGGPLPAAAVVAHTGGPVPAKCGSRRSSRSWWPSPTSGR